MGEFICTRYQINKNESTNIKWTFVNVVNVDEIDFGAWLGNDLPFVLHQMLLHLHNLA